MIHVLRVLADGKVRSRREIRPLVAVEAGLTESQRSQALSSGQLTYENRIGWGLSFLANVGALDRPSRGHYVITPAGLPLIERFPNGFRERDLDELAKRPGAQIRAYESTVTHASQHPVEEVAATPSMTPTEQVQDGVRRIHDEVAQQVLERLQGKEPGFFEQAVVKLLVAMGYGGVGGSGSVTKLSNDGGIDGVIDQDVLGLSRVYIQAKRYASTNVVQRPEVQGFVGALHGKADSGVFITTSRFSAGAKEYVAFSPTRIILIDGSLLAELMIRYGVGVQVSETYSLVKIDEDFFA